MKRRISLLLAVVMIFGSFGNVFAAGTTIEEEAAEFLSDNEILLGDKETGDLLLDQKLKRQDAVVMLSRLMGEEEDAKTHRVIPEVKNFKDVKSQFYSPYISWGVSEGYFMGQSKTAFGFNQPTKAVDYAQVLLRALGYNDVVYKNVFEESKALGLLDNVSAREKTTISRGQFSVMTLNALSTKLNGENKTLGEKLGIDMPNNEPSEVKLSIEFISATEDKVTIEFNEKIDAVKASNFKIEGLSVDGAKLVSGDKKVELDISGAKPGEGYTVKVSGLKSGGKETTDTEMFFMVPEREDLVKLNLVFEGLEKEENPTIVSDGVSEVVVRAELVDAYGDLIKDAGKVEIAFTTTLGRFGEKRVTAENGVARNTLISEVLDVDRIAEIRAVVLEAEDKELIGMKSEDFQLIMSPNPDHTEITIGARLGKVQAKQADRITAFFNKNVDVNNYFVKDSKKIDPKKADIKVMTNINGVEKECRVVGLKPIEGNSKALEIILDTDTVLTDNEEFKVTFNDKTGNVEVGATKKNILIDSREPAMLYVEREDLNKIRVVFSEPVESKTANNTRNWVIDGFRLDSNKFGVNKKATAEVQKFDEKTGKDERHVVLITLGEDNRGNQIYFNPGLHSVQGSSIKDWAGLTDLTNQNIMNTQTLNFEVPSDKTKPNASVEVQSPEQYIVKLDTEIKENLTENDIKLQVKVNGRWEDASSKETNRKFAQKPDIRVTRNSEVEEEYKVELVRDWTRVYDTNSSSRNYYNDEFRLLIGKNKATAVKNGMKNDDIVLPLTGAMLKEDTVSPSIDKYNDKTKIVTMSEPVKFPADMGDKLPTLGQNQKSIPKPTAEFIYQTDKMEDRITIPAKEIEGKFEDFYDTEFKVEPRQELKPGKWKLVVRSISDDYGNTASSAEFVFEVAKKEEVKLDFEVVEITKLEEKKVDSEVVIKENTVLEVTFSKAYKRAGQGNALETSNYILNGKPLPNGTQINAVNSDNIVKLRIILPEGYLNDDNNALTISQRVTSFDGEKLKNPGTYKVDFSKPSN